MRSLPCSGLRSISISGIVLAYLDSMTPCFYGCDGKGEAECRSLPKAALDGDLPAKRLDKPAHEREAEGRFRRPRMC